MRRKRFFRAGLVVGVLVAVAAGVALATPGSGFVGEVIARGTVNGPIKIKTDHPSDFVVQTINVAPGGFSGWHTHPGATLVTVKSGTLVLTDRHCNSTTYEAGDAFFQPANEVHNATNPSAHDSTVLWTAYVLPVGAAIRTDAPNPGCP